jgi:hypothetical protein
MAVILPPYFLKPTTDDLFSYYQAISNADWHSHHDPRRTAVDGRQHWRAQMASNGARVANVRYAKVEAPPTA